MVVNLILSSVSCSVAPAGSIPAFPAYIGAANQTTSATASVSGTVGSASIPYTQYTYNYVTLDGTIVNQTTAQSQNFCRYCEYPGERLFTHIQFQVSPF